jgi:hypothetical protein
MGLYYNTYESKVKLIPSIAEVLRRGGSRSTDQMRREIE